MSNFGTKLCSFCKKIQVLIKLLSKFTYSNSFEQTLKPSLSNI